MTKPPWYNIVTMSNRTARWNKQDAPPLPRAAQAARPVYARSLILASAAVVLAGVAWGQAADNTFRPLGVAAWLAAIACWVVAWWDGERPHLWPARRADVLRFLLPAVLVLLVAGLFRFYRLAEIPPEMTSDHAEKLLDVRDVLNGLRPIFFPRNTGREPAQFYLTAVLAGPLGFGLSHMALKVGTALVGWLTVPLTIWAVRWGGGYSRRVALLTGFFLAVSKWHVEITRVGLRFPYTPLAVAMTLGFLLRALRTSRRRYWVLTGIAAGLGLYGYTATRIVPLVLVVALGLWALEPAGRGASAHVIERAAQALQNGVLVALSALVAFVPLLRFSLEHPELFWYRSASRLAEGMAEPGLATFLLNVKNAALMFHVRGDVVWVNTVPYDPVLDRVTGIFFAVGLVYLAYRLWRRPSCVDGVLLAALPILLLPSILALAWPNENPSVVRTSGTIPVVMTITALGLDALWRYLDRGRDRWSLLAKGALAVLLGAALAMNWHTYFRVYPQTYARSAWNSTEIAAEIRRIAPAVGGTGHVYIFSYPHWVDTRNVAFNMGEPDWNSVLFQVSEIASKRPEPRAVILNPRDGAHREALLDLWPGACAWVVSSRTPGKEFVVVAQAPYCQAIRPAGSER